MSSTTQQILIKLEQLRTLWKKYPSRRKDIELQAKVIKSALEIFKEDETLEQNIYKSLL